MDKAKTKVGVIFALALITILISVFAIAKPDTDRALATNQKSGNVVFIPAHAMNSLHDLKKFKHACLNTGYTFEKKENLIDTFLKIKNNTLQKVHLNMGFLLSSAS